MKTLDEDLLKKELKIHAKGVGIPAGAADEFVKRTLKEVLKSLKNKKIITDGDLERAVVRELKKYNADLAYIYKNRGKII